MAFHKFTNYKRRGAGGKVSIRFTEGVAYLSAGLVHAASTVLHNAGTLDEDKLLRFVELFFDKGERRIGVKPIGHKGLNEADVKGRTGVRMVTGKKTKTISVRGFQEECGIADKTVFELKPETHENKSLPEDNRQFILFVSPPQKA